MMRRILRFENSVTGWRWDWRRARLIVFCVSAGICVGFVAGLLLHARISRTQIQA